MSIFKLTAIVITPSLPTFSMAFAINSPISLSPLADIVPTCHCKIKNTKLRKTTVLQSLWLSPLSWNILLALKI